jgi:hypothetical protein
MFQIKIVDENYELENLFPTTRITGCKCLAVPERGQRIVFKYMKIFNNYNECHNSPHQCDKMVLLSVSDSLFNLKFKNVCIH